MKLIFYTMMLVGEWIAFAWSERNLGLLFLLAIGPPIILLAIAVQVLAPLAIYPVL